MSSAAFPQGYSARAPTAADAGAVAGLIAACQLAVGDRSGMTAEELRGDWEDIALLEDAVAVEARNGGLVAYADVLNRSYVSVSVYGYVHPGHRGRGLGAFLVGWGEGWARERLDLAPEGARVVVQFYVYPRSEARFPVFSDPGASGTIIGGGMLARGVRERSKHGVRVARGGGVSPLPLGS